MSEKLGTLLIKAGLINEEQLNLALEKQQETSGKLGSILVEMEFISEEKLIQFLSKQFRVQSINLNDIVVDPSLLQSIPPKLATKYNVFPVRREGRNLYLAMSNPSNVFAVEDIKFTTNLNIIPLVAPDKIITQYIEKYFESQELLDEVIDDDIIDDEIEIIKKDENEEADDAAGDLAASVDSGPVVKMVNSLITRAVETMASDLHIEPYDRDLRIRYKIDGVLQALSKTKTPPWKYRKSMISRIKIMAKMKLQESRLPQDGRIKVKVHGKPIDIRVAIVPTMYGEKAAMRILDREKVEFKFDKLGFDPDMEKYIEKAIRNPVGIVLITGPTGCGKTTTLYTCVEKINNSEVNITTAEDPVEFSILGVNQLQVNESVGLTFASALRAYLRQDPNIIMVGEIRDKETAEIAIRASLTGHLVLSSVHTNSACGTVTRLINMGVEPFLIASTINLLVSQRLLRTICTNCKVQDIMNDDELLEKGLDPKELGGSPVYKGEGCDKCGQTGYKGMVGIFETLEISNSVRRAILENKSTDELRDIALKDEETYFVTMREAAMRKLKMGIIDVLELVKETTLR